MKIWQCVVYTRGVIYLACNRPVYAEGRECGRDRRRHPDRNGQHNVSRTGASPSLHNNEMRSRYELLVAVAADLKASIDRPDRRYSGHETSRHTGTS